MDKGQRIEIAVSQIEAGKTDEEILSYLTDELKLDLTEKTLKNDIKEAHEFIATQSVGDDSKGTEKPQETTESTGEEGSETTDTDTEDTSGNDQDEEDDQEEETEEVEEEDQEPQDEKEARIVDEVKARIQQGDEEAEILEDITKDHGEMFARKMLFRAQGSIELEEMQVKAEDAKKQRDKYLGELNKFVGPAIKHLEKAIECLEQARKFAAKNGKSATRFSAHGKVLTRTLKSLNSVE